MELKKRCEPSLLTLPAVAAGVLATESLRTDGSAKTVPVLREELLAYFAANQERVNASRAY